MKQCKRLLSILLALAMVIGMIPITTRAAQSDYLSVIQACKEKCGYDSLSEYAQSMCKATLVDIEQDGQSELLVQYPDSLDVVELWTLENSEPVCLLKKSVMASSGISYYLASYNGVAYFVLAWFDVASSYANDYWNLYNVENNSFALEYELYSAYDYRSSGSRKYAINGSSATESEYNEILDCIKSGAEISMNTFEEMEAVLNTSHLVASGTCGDNLMWELSPDGTLTITGSGDMYDYQFDGELPPWRDYNNAITSVIIEDGVSTVGEYAFFSYCNLHSVSIPDSIISICEGAFLNCYNLTNVILGKGLKKIDDSAFYSCYRLKEVTIPDSVTAIGAFAFESCSDLTKVIIGKNVTTIGNYAFSYRANAYTKTIDGGVFFRGNAPSIGEGAFENIRASAYFPTGNNTWTEEVKQNYGGDLVWVEYTPEEEDEYVASGTCGDNLTWVYDEGVLTISGDGEIPAYTFENNRSPWSDNYGGEITSVVIDEGVTGIGGGFAWHTALETITIGKSVTSITNKPFYNCFSLREIIFCGDAPVCDPYIFEFITATAYYPAGNSTWTDEVKQNYGGNLTWVEYTPEKPAFEESMYRADYLLGDHANNLEYYTYYVNNNSPARIVMSINDLKTANEIWSLVTVALDTIADGDAAVKYNFEQVDIYETLLLNALTNSTDSKAVSNWAVSTMKTITKAEKTIASRIKDIIFLEHNWELATNAKYKDMTPEQIQQIRDAYKKVIESELSIEAAALQSKEILDFLDEFMSIATTVDDLVSKTLLYAQLWQISDDTAVVLDEMYTQASGDPELWAMRDALAFCSSMIKQTNAWLFEEGVMLRSGFMTAGKYTIEKGIEFVWKSVREKAISANPKLAILLATYKASRAVVNVLGNTDDISEHTFKVCAITKYYDILERTMSSLEARYISSRNRGNARAVLNALSLWFGFAIEDCDASQKYVDTVDNAALYEIKEAFQNAVDKLLGTESEGSETAMRYAKNTKASFQQMAKDSKINWVYQLKNDYPEVYPYYEDLVKEDYEESEPLIVPITSTYEINCPVDIYVYDSLGNQVANIVGDTVWATDALTVTKQGDSKFVEFYDKEDYRIECVGYDEGTMDVTARFYEDGAVVRTANFYDLEIAEDCIYEMENSPELTNETYTVSNKGENIPADYDTVNDSSSDPVTVKVNNGFVLTDDGPQSEITAYPNQKIEITAYIPEGYVFRGWKTNSENNGIKDIQSAATSLIVRDYSLTITADIEEIAVIRIAGSDRIATSLMLAAQLKEVLGVEKFDAVVVASALNFPDALTGSYLAAEKNAPILLTYPAAHAKIRAYIQENLKPGGMVYILGGEGAVSADFADGLDGFNIKRLAGSDRFGTNLAIMEEAGVSADQPVLIATAVNFADSLSASAAGLPMVLVYGSLREDQKEFLATTSRNFIIIGGEAAVSPALEAELKAIGSVTRVAGSSRYETSVLVAERFVQNPDAVILAYAKNFPDGLCGGPLAYALGAPLILTDSGAPGTADAYVENITAGIVVGGTGLISDSATRDIFDLAANAEIQTK